ncbi:MAG: hypothetical protein ACTMKU_09140, partial [Actinomycetaceae bacterium]
MSGTPDRHVHDTPTGDRMTTTNPPTTDLESGVRSYSRSWPTTFTTAVGSTMTAEDGTEYLD